MNSSYAQSCFGLATYNNPSKPPCPKYTLLTGREAHNPIEVRAGNEGGIRPRGHRS